MSQSKAFFSHLRAGASGYLLKKKVETELIPAIQDVNVGGAPMSMQIARKVVDFFHQIKKPTSEMETLTDREKEILGLLAKGYFNKEIVDLLNVSMNTVRMHLKHIYKKLHVQSRTEAVIKFVGHE